MLLRCVRPFGNFEPGKTVEVPDGAVYDGAYFERDDPEPVPEPVVEKAPAVAKEEVK